MKLVLLGTGGYFPTSRRQTACFMLPEIGVVLDAGTGMSRLPKFLATSHLDVFLTHAHLDHVAGLTYLVNLVPADVLEQTTVHGVDENLGAVKEHLFAKPIFPVAPKFRFQPLDASTPLTNGGQLTAFPLTHPGGSIGFRIDWNDRSMAYITDTTAAKDASYIEKIRGVDLLLHEAYFDDESKNLPAITGHSALLPTAELAAAAGVGRLVLIHLNPMANSDDYLDIAAARSRFPKVDVGEDMMEIEF